jgi:hypothetical protein
MGRRPLQSYVGIGTGKGDRAPTESEHESEDGLFGAPASRASNSFSAGALVFWGLGFGHGAVLWTIGIHSARRTPFLILTRTKPTLALKGGVVRPSLRVRCCPPASMPLQRCLLADLGNVVAPGQPGAKAVSEARTAKAPNGATMMARIRRPRRPVRSHRPPQRRPRRKPARRGRPLTWAPNSRLGRCRCSVHSRALAPCIWVLAAVGNVCRRFPFLAAPVGAAV